MVFRKKTIILTLLILLTYFLLRTLNLGLLPINNDESTYIRFGLHQLKEPDHRPYSLFIGKEPLLPYLYAVFGTGFGNLLLGARWVTILFGLLALAGLYLFTKTLFGKRAAFFTSFFYCIAPFTVFFDRLALLDSPVSVIAIWSLYFTYLLLQKAKWRYAVALGALMGIGLWIKTSDVFYIFLPLISYGISFFTNGDTAFIKAKMFGAALGIALIVFLPLFSNPLYAVHMQLLQQYTYPWYSVFLFPVSIWWNNFLELIEWLFFYLTPPLFLLAAGSLIIFRKQKNILLLLLWFYLPFVYEMLYDKLFASRHVLLLTVPLFIFAGYGMEKLWQKRQIAAFLLGVVILAWTLFSDFVMISSPQQYASLFVDRAYIDMRGYSHGWPSGYGIPEAVNYLKQQARTQRIIVVIRNDHGNPEDAIVAYLDYQPRIILVVSNNPRGDVQFIFQKIGTSIPVYFVSRGAYYAGLEKYFAAKKEFMIPNDEDHGFVGVIRLKPAN